MEALDQRVPGEASGMFGSRRFLLDNFEGLAINLTRHLPFNKWWIWFRELLLNLRNINSCTFLLVFHLLFINELLLFHHSIFYFLELIFGFLHLLLFCDFELLIRKLNLDFLKKCDLSLDDCIIYTHALGLFMKSEDIFCSSRWRQLQGDLWPWTLLPLLTLQFDLITRAILSSNISIHNDLRYCHGYPTKLLLIEYALHLLVSSDDYIHFRLKWRLRHFEFLRSTEEVVY